VTVMPRLCTGAALLRPRPARFKLQPRSVFS
jgi:hypothetical protein